MTGSGNCCAVQCIQLGRVATLRPVVSAHATGGAICRNWNRESPARFRRSVPASDQHDLPILGLPRNSRIRWLTRRGGQRSASRVRRPSRNPSAPPASYRFRQRSSRGVSTGGGSATAALCPRGSTPHHAALRHQLRMHAVAPPFPGDVPEMLRCHGSDARALHGGRAPVRAWRWPGNSCDHEMALFMLIQRVHPFIVRGASPERCEILLHDRACVATSDLPGHPVAQSCHCALRPRNDSARYGAFRRGRAAQRRRTETDPECVPDRHSRNDLDGEAFAPDHPVRPSLNRRSRGAPAMAHAAWFGTNLGVLIR